MAFPYLGEYGGEGIRALMYLFFLLILGLPILVMEFSVGRAMKRILYILYALEPEGNKWHTHSVFSYGANYTFDDVLYHQAHGGWMLAYFVKMLEGRV